MTPRDEYDLFLSILKKRHLIVDYTLSEDGTKLDISPVKPLDCVEIDFKAKDVDGETDSV